MSLDYFSETEPFALFCDEQNPRPSNFHPDISNHKFPCRQRLAYVKPPFKQPYSSKKKQTTSSQNNCRHKFHKMSNINTKHQQTRSSARPHRESGGLSSGDMAPILASALTPSGDAESLDLLPDFVALSHPLTRMCLYHHVSSIPEVSSSIGSPSTRLCARSSCHNDHKEMA